MKRFSDSSSLSRKSYPQFVNCRFRPEYVSCLSRRSNKNGRASSFALIRFHLDSPCSSRQLGTKVFLCVRRPPPEPLHARAARVERVERRLGRLLLRTTRAPCGVDALSSAQSCRLRTQARCTQAGRHADTQAKAQAQIDR
eukprot:1178777-Pleurochrysis_carterae.AAC.3